MMKYVLIVFVAIAMSSCGNKCEVCEVVKDGQMIEQYESCDEEGIETSKSICEEMAKLQDAECECRKK